MRHPFILAMVLVSFIFLGRTIAIAAQPTFLPVAATGYNEDVIVEASANPNTGYAGTDTRPFDLATRYTWFETGLIVPGIGAAPGGLTPGNPLISFTNAAGAPSQFQLQPYTALNALMLNQTNSTGTLTFNKPAVYNQISILDSDTFGSAAGTVTLNFSDGTHSSPLSFTYDDWWAQTSATPAPVKTPFLVGGTQLHTPFSTADMYDTTFDLTGTPNATKPISGLTVSYAGTSDAGVFAVSATPEPTAVSALLVVGMLGATRRRRVR
jgi:hypothetical protein